MDYKLFMSEGICISRLRSSLDDTVDWMLSPLYEERFKAEFYQLSIRIYELKKILEEYENGPIDSTLPCSYNILVAQLHAMESYIYCMQERARQENVEL